MKEFIKKNALDISISIIKGREPEEIAENYPEHPYALKVINAIEANWPATIHEINEAYYQKIFEIVTLNAYA